ncbi:hypothetical protein IWW39_003151 [Coemansia spiralis]|uniref:Sphingomyelin synthase-like domain-containing protein n=1 Tax=Coemansia spiralis TaxID=417178 RepID=A0A9W8GEH4_9FUNG|nr:hypothetical protein IWW39_003151 [Coemansia spiralis]
MGRWLDCCGSFNGRLVLREVAHTGLAWASLALVTVWMVLCQEWSDMRWVQAQAAHGGKHGERSSEGGLLYDVILAQLPFVRETWVTDVLVNSAGLACVLGSLCMARSWQARIILVRRVGWMMAALYLLRSFTLSITTLPPSVADCKPVVATEHIGLLDSVPGLISGRLSACTDKMFSGHTTILVISFLFWRRYATHWAFLVYSAVHTAVGIASILLVRLHYSVDVLLAVVLTCAVHHVYYRNLDAAIRRRRRVSALRHRRNRSLFAGPDDAPLGADTAYVRVDVEDDDELSAVSTSGDALVRLFGRRMTHRRDGSINVALDAVLPTTSLPSTDSARTLTNNSPVQDAAHVVDVEKAAVALAAAAAVAEPYYSSSVADDEDTLIAMAINRPMGSALSTLVGWLDGLHLR